MFFLPVGETAMTTSTLFPQRLQSFARLLEPDLEATSVLDFAFPAIVFASFHISIYEQITQISRLCLHAHNFLIVHPLLGLVKRGKPSGIIAGVIIYANAKKNVNNTLLCNHSVTD
jgi:hypothetical protein